MKSVQPVNTSIVSVNEYLWNFLHCKCMDSILCSVWCREFVERRL